MNKLSSGEYLWKIYLLSLGDITKESYGAGLRLVSASGFVYRADYAKGAEGEEVTVMFSYPW